MTSLELLPTIHLDSDFLFCCCNWWLAALSWQGVVTTFKMIGDWQLHCDNAPTYASRLVQSFFDKTSSHPGDPTPLQPRFGALWCLAFPKTKIPFEREEVSDCWWDSGKYDRAADGDWENCVRSQVPTLKGSEASLSYAQCFLYLVSSSIHVSIFHVTWLDTFWTDLVLQRTLPRYLSSEITYKRTVSICSILKYTFSIVKWRLLLEYNLYVLSQRVCSYEIKQIYLDNLFLHSRYFLLLGL